MEATAAKVVVMVGEVEVTVMVLPIPRA